MPRKIKWHEIAFATVPAIIGILTFVEYFFDFNFGVDEFFIRDTGEFPGRMSPNTALIFLLLSAALLFTDSAFHKKYFISEICALISSLLVLPSLLGYLYGVQALFTIQRYTQIALHAAITFTVLSVGIFLLKPDRGLARELLSNTQGGLSLRGVIPQLIICIAALGWLRLQGQKLGLYDMSFGISIMVIGTIVISIFLLWRNSRLLNQTDQLRHQAEAQYEAANYNVQLMEVKVRKESVVQDLMDRLDMALNAVNMGAWSFDFATQSIWRSANYDEIFGYSEPRAEWSQEFFLSHVLPEDLDRVKKEFRGATDGGRIYSQCRIRRADNQMVTWIEIQGETKFDSCGEPNRMMGVVVDITARKCADETLKHALQDNALYRSALDESAIVVFTDKKGAITHVNDLFCKISGYSKEELLGQNHRILNSGVHPKEFFTDIWRTISSQKVWRGEICNRAKNGNIYWVDTYIVPCLNGSGDIERYFAVRFDITKRKLAEEQLMHSAKMSSLGRMASGVAHEINNPLTIVYGQAHRLKKITRGLPNGSRVRESINQIEQMSLRIMETIDGLKTFAREGANDSFVFVSLRKIVDETLSFCKGKLTAEGVDLKIDHIPEDIEIYCRSVQISQVLLNFLNNARDSVDKLEKKEIAIGFVSTETQVGIYIQDNGPGVPSNLISNLFEPFFTTKEVGKGTGLGLSVSKGIVDSHDGHIFHEAVSPHGARFVFLLPKVI